MKTTLNKFLILCLIVVPFLFSFENNKKPVLKFSRNSNIWTAKVDTANGPVIFNATHLINFDQTKISSTGEPIDIISLKKKKDLALQLLDSIVNTPQFKERVLDGDFTHKRGMSNQQIYDLFMTNRPDIKKIREHLTLVIDTTYQWNVVNQRGLHPSIGYDNQPGDSTVHTVQIQLIKNLSAKDYAAHIAHEYCHMIGFTHPWPGKFRGVPYGIQNIITDMLNIRSDPKAYR